MSAHTERLIDRACGYVDLPDDYRALVEKMQECEHLRAMTVLVHRNTLNGCLA